MAARRRSNRERSIWPHQDGRRTGAAYLAHKDLGVLPRDTMKILGHARIAVTMELYTEPDDASRRAGLTKLSAFLNRSGLTVAVIRPVKRSKSQGQLRSQCH